MDAFSDALKNLPSVPGETSEFLADRIERILNEKFGKQKE